MAASAKPLPLLLLAMFLIFGKVTSKPSLSSSPGNDETLSTENHDSSISRNQHHDSLKSRVSAVESIINEKNQELIVKEAKIQNMEMATQANSDTIALLQSEIEFVQSASSDKHNGKAEQVHQLEKQIFKLNRKVEVLERRKLELETRAEVAEKKAAELGSKLENINLEQKQRIHDTEYSLKAAEKQLQKAESDAALTYKFIKINGEWLLYKLDVYLSQAQGIVVTQWNKCLRPTLYATAQKVYEKKDQVKKWSEPHIETLNSKWIPTIKDVWLIFTTYLEPKIQSLTDTSIKVYQSYKQSLTPCLIQALNATNSYIQVAKMHARPYFSRVVIATKPHLDKAHVIFEPYLENIRNACTKLVNSTRTYHQQAQELLKNNELTKPVATVDLAWFAATALLSFPLLFIIKLLSAISNTKQKRDYHKHHAINGHRRAKRSRY